MADIVYKRNRPMATTALKPKQNQATGAAAASLAVRRMLLPRSSGARRLRQLRRRRLADVAARMRPASMASGSRPPCGGAGAAAAPGVLLARARPNRGADAPAANQ